MPFFTLQRRLVLFLLLPVALLLVTMGWIGFYYARTTLLREWQEAAVLKLQRAAHQVDMRLSEAKLWMQMFHKTGGEPQPEAIQKWIVKQLNALEGVEQASLQRFDGKLEGSHRRPHSMFIRAPSEEQWSGMMAFERAQITEITPPRYDERAGHETISLISDLLNGSGDKIGELKVVVLFSQLIASALSHGWEGEKAFLIDSQGNVLACNTPGEREQICSDEQTFEALLEAVKQKPWGTIFEPSRTSHEVIGFYRLNEAPWALVLTAQDEKILAPIYKFRNITVVGVASFILFILLLIRIVAGRTVTTIGQVSQAARQVAKGNFQIQLASERTDEVGQLVRSFNIMVNQLEERIRLKEALGLAMEVQQNLLPLTAPRLYDLDIAGASFYCDQTGGDYYDYFTFSDSGAEKLAVAVGDVAGHGISAALLMTTARAMLRTRLLQPGRLGEVVSDVNRLLCSDTDRTSDFMTLYLLMLDPARGELHWVRAGHAPAIIYDWQTDRFEELRGDGPALGLLDANQYTEYSYPNWNRSQIIFLGTDGIWETESPEGEMYGMERLRTILREHSRSSAQAIVNAVMAELENFRKASPQTDDITMVVLKSA